MIFSFFKENKNFIAIVLAGGLIALAIYFSDHHDFKQYNKSNLSILNENFKDKEVLSQKQTLGCVNISEAKNYVGEYKCVSGKVDNVYISKKGNIFLNFCPNYKSCTFSAVIFSSDSFKFPSPKNYQGKFIKILGLIKTYQGKAQIIINDPEQIKINNENQNKENSGPYKVVEIIDGDTITVDINGNKEIIRLLGIDAPELPNECFAKEAFEKLKEILNNQFVYLNSDSLSQDKDKYGRLLRYVYLPSDFFVNAWLIEKGYAFNYIYEPFELMNKFNLFEKMAKENKLGLWANCEYFIY